RSKLRTELNQHRPELGAECADAIEELGGEVRAIAQPMLVRDLLRKLQREGKMPRRALGPTLYLALGWHRVARELDSNGIERARIHGEEIGGACVRRIERAHPGIVVPALCPDPHRGGHGLKFAMRCLAVSSGARRGGAGWRRRALHF